MVLKEIKKMKKLKISILTVLLIIAGSNIKAQNTISGSEDGRLNEFAIRLYASPPHSLLATNLKSNTYGAEETEGLGSNFGVDFVYYYYAKGKLRASVSFGLAYSDYRAFRNSSYERSLWTTDIDVDNVFLTEIVNDMFEIQSFRYLDIPIKFGFEYTLSENVNVYMTFGASYGISLKGKYTNEATITRNGYYPITNALIFDVDVDGSPYFYPTNKRMESEDVIAIKNNISFIAALGIKHKVNSKISIIAGLKYMHGVNDIMDENSTFIIKHDDAYHYSLNSLASRGDQIKTSSFGLELGVQINIWEVLK